MNRPYPYVLAVARCHGTTLAARWGGIRHQQLVVACIAEGLDAVDLLPAPLHCRCPRCAGPGNVDRALLAGVQEGYGSQTLGRMHGMTGAEVRMRLAELRGPSIQSWVDVGRRPL